MGKRCQTIQGREVCSKPHLFMRSYLGYPPFPLFSDAAQDVFDLMVTDPQAEAKTPMATFIDSQTLSGNLAKHDSFWYMGLDTEPNSKVDWRGLSNGDVANTPTFTPFDGWTLNGTTQYFNTSFLPSTNGSNFTQNDAFVWVFIDSDVADGRIIFGWRDAGAQRNQIVEFVGDIRYGINSTISVLAGDVLEADNLYGTERLDAANQQLYEAGIQLDTDAMASSALVDKEVYFGARNNNDVADLFYTGIIKAGGIGGGGLNWPSLNTDLTTLITALDALQ